MKFFSNEAKENTDDERDRGDVVTSEPAAVPQQRAGSPWNDTPGDSSGDTASDTTTDTVTDSAADDERAEGERREQTDAWGHTEPSTTTYGPDGTVTETGTDTDRDNNDRDDFDRPADTDAETHDDQTRDDEANDDLEAKNDLETRDEDLETKDSLSEDEALKDEGTFDSPEAVDPATGERVDEPLAEDRVDTSEESEVEPQAHPESTLDSTVDDTPADDTPADEDAKVEEQEQAGDEAYAADESRTDDEADNAGPASYEPERIDPATGEAYDKTEPFVPVPVAVAGDSVNNDTDRDTDRDTETDTDRDVDAAPVVAAVPVDTSAAASTPAAATPGGTVESLPDRLFADGDSFLERFREIQLGFVDTPKESAGQAASLVAEAVDSFTTALNARKDALAANSDDTEQLRVELRGYRDLLNRITGL